MLTEIEQNPDVKINFSDFAPCYAEKDRSRLVTPYSLMLILAYLQYYTPERLPDRRFLSPKHLQALTRWLGAPPSKIRSLFQAPLLALHIACLQTAQLISSNHAQIVLTPSVNDWLHLPSAEQIHYLEQSVKNESRWHETSHALGLQNVLTEVIYCFLQQTLAKQHDNFPAGQASKATWQEGQNPDIWHLNLPHTLPLWLHFDLRQLGNWQPGGQPLTCSAQTICTAVQRGYGRHHIEWLFKTASQQPLSEKKRIQLNRWYRQANAYQIRTVHLLTTAQPEQMQQLQRRKLFRKETIEQLSPRHAIVASTMQGRLSNWLKKRGEPGPRLISNHKNESESKETPAGYQWLGVRLLIGLGEIIPLPYPAPHQILAALSDQISLLEQTELEAKATHLVNSLRQSLRGQDAFFPAQHKPCPSIMAQIQKAIEQETSLKIMYQALAETKPSWRIVEPLYSQQKGQLTYLYAYCRRAEMNLTFRLDRIKKIV